MDSILARNRYAADCDLGDLSKGGTHVSDEILHELPTVEEIKGVAHDVRGVTIQYSSQEIGSGPKLEPWCQIRLSVLEALRLTRLLEQMRRDLGSPRGEQ